MSLKSVNNQNLSLSATDRLVREDERRFISSVSRSQAWVLEQQGLFPKRIRLGNRSVAWRLSELLEWVKTREGVQS
ncbi:transcriptional regulator [Vibrio parahaemolyticus]|nr:AlpA family phage regulatory protein [Vibrio parahaemolyticus]MBE3945142.1 AlpA family phage regulatory protein [Vibrio parahaemolyticus]MBE4119971.1 AlpA family phage regulatory protein [Vibrio parahaemolyticus]MBE4439546.1 AlpA family phage regulatory protein [Vibrio parahaemolyticus]MBE4780765.1 AlpA family phage regulatory protein [Vibrio parahaemolyticus]